jgi:aryl-alcohol dehydrogenase-like predicted oxidoreductase
LEETFDAYAQLLDQGKVRAIGASNYSAARLAQAMRISREKGYPDYQVLEPLYNLYDRGGYEKELEPLCRQEGLGVITYSSLASGFLTGKYRAPADEVKSARGGAVQNYMNERGFRIVEALQRIAKERNTTPASLALAWLIARPSVTAPIASATNLVQLNDLIAAPELKLDLRAIDDLDAVSSW